MAMCDGWPGPVDYQKQQFDKTLQEQGKTINNLSMRLKQLEDKLNKLTINTPVHYCLYDPNTKLMFNITDSLDIVQKWQQNYHKDCVIITVLQN